MTTPLEKTLKRALKIAGRDYVLAIFPNGLKLTLKGKRKGLELAWDSLVSGEAALATALNASIGKFPVAEDTDDAPQEAHAAPAASDGRARTKSGKRVSRRPGSRPRKSK